MWPPNAVWKPRVCVRFRHKKFDLPFLPCRIPSSSPSPSETRNLGFFGQTPAVQRQQKNVKDGKRGGGHTDREAVMRPPAKKEQECKCEPGEWLQTALSITLKHTAWIMVYIYTKLTHTEWNPQKSNKLTACTANRSSHSECEPNTRHK